MPDQAGEPTEKGSGFSVEDLQEAIKRDMLALDDDVGDFENQNVPIGRDIYNEDLAAAEKVIAEDKGATPDQGEPVVAAQPDPVDPAPEVTPASVDDGGTELTPEQLEDYYVHGTVYGEKEKYSLKDLLAIKQTQDAASRQLDDAKALNREYKNIIESYKGVQDAQPATPATPEYGEYVEPPTDEELRISRLSDELVQVKDKQTSFERSQLLKEEDAYVLSKIQGSGVSEAEAEGRIHEVLNKMPTLRPFAEKLWGTDPQTPQDLADRKAMFESVWAIAEKLDTPKVILQAREQGIEDGREAAKTESKRELTTVSGGGSQPTEKSMDERIHDASRAPDAEDAMADLLLESDLFKSF